MTKKTHEKQARNMVIILLVLLVIFIFILKLSITPNFKQDETGKSKTFLGLFDKETNHYFYNGFEVRKIIDGPTSHHFEILIHINRQLAILKTKFGPKELEDITITEDVINTVLDSKKIWITFEDINSTAISAVASLEIEKFTDNPYLWDISTDPAYTQQVGNLSAITCENATETTTVILMHPSDKTMISNSGTCVTIDAETEMDFVRAANKLGLALAGVIKPNYAY